METVHLLSGHPDKKCTVSVGWLQSMKNVQTNNNMQTSTYLLPFFDHHHYVSSLCV